MIRSRYLSTKLIIRTILKLLDTIFSEEIGHSIRVSGPDGVIELFEPFARNVLGGKSRLRGRSCGLVDGRIGQFEGPQVLLEDGSHCTGHVSVGDR